MQILNWQPKYESQVLALLNHYLETSIFLLDNLKKHGPYLTDAMFSGDFKCIVQGETVLGVFSFTRAGTIILQTDRAEDYSIIIVDVCKTEIERLRGVVAAWELADPLWSAFEKKFPELCNANRKKEVLYKYDLTTYKEVSDSEQVKFLCANDYLAWDKLNLNLLQEVNLKPDGDSDARKKTYLEMVAEKCCLGFFVNQQLVSICSLIANVDAVGQIGSVYTLPIVRNKGYAKKMLQQLMSNCKRRNIKKLVLFTDENNLTARSLYEKLGFKSIGYFGLIFVK